ncbi:MAG: hypothetical protein WAO71_08190 [Gallionella sp.]
MIENLNMHEVRGHYDARFECHQHLCTLLKTGKATDFLDLALGISDPIGNFSAREHGLGPMVLSANRPASIIKLAESFLSETDPNKMVGSIYAANIKYLKVSVGSEMAMMLKPSNFWVANVRTVWTHLLLKHCYDLGKANEELKLYRSQEMTSEMEYQIWKEIYRLMKPSIAKVCEKGNAVANEQGAESGSLSYMWFDAIANSLYEQFAAH